MANNPRNLLNAYDGSGPAVPMTLQYAPPASGSPYGRIVPLASVPSGAQAGGGTMGAAALPGNLAPFQGYPSPPPSADALLVRQAALRALGLVNPGQNEDANVQPYTDDTAKVVDPSAIDTKNWQHTWSPYARNPVESPVPGYPSYVVKAYDDPSLGNTIAVTYPTWSFRHIVDAIPDDIFHYPINPGIAQDFLNATGGNKNGRK